MAVTAQQIAELAGVSRGTVDRALHNRGRVNPEVAAKIHKIAAELGYKPNLIGQALVKSRREFKLGAILQSTETPTMQIVRAGVQRAAEELAASGVELIMRENRGLDTEMVLEHIEELVSQGVQGLAIAPNNSPEIRQCTGQQASCVHRYGQLPRRTDRRRLASADAARGRQGASAGGTLE